ncbi:prepilin-type N-terminal cleavage/methylation domain-containing protein [Lysobacter sp. KIS68-7]|uniref:PilW family protein n=1 Tax=Lysobacter sp. KIS68-7 TaxID=2904252 RepID=UPI001E5A9F3A|nr:prepilin-type N-terminal cleavage/methylation domain-containing protein [Lysobacter sp. KIS68-7]UHQ19611.1 prepilin-type N-terminal cleavage/methylation domain-containing protein [Lysobacter sp. KIS68-7]
MLMHRAPSLPRHARGFSLVEMMVALVLGLLVVAAVLAFIFSLIRANSETVLSMRLNQEMRATMSLIAADIRRARSLSDPIAAVGQGGVVTNPYSNIDVSTANCMRYSYSESTGGATNYRALRLDNGKVVLVRAATAAGAACTSAGTPLNTDGVVITGLSFSNPGGNARRIDVVLTGRLKNPPSYMSKNPSMAVSAKTIRQTVSIRSNGT